MILGKDVSGWQDPHTMPWAETKEHGFRFAIVKASMGGGPDYRCDQHSSYIKNAGVDLGLYHWLDPTQDWIRQADFFLKRIDHNKPNVVSMDVEQYWADWNNKAGPRIPSSKQVDCFETVMEHVLDRSGLVPQRHWTYSAKWFLDMYPALVPAISTYKLWVASYVRYQFGYEQVSRITWEKLDEILNTMRGPVLPTGMTDHLVWQFESIFILPPARVNLDLNLFNGDEEAYAEVFGKDVQPPDPKETILKAVWNIEGELDAIKKVL